MGSLSLREKIILTVLVLLLITGALWKTAQIRVPKVEYVESLPTEEQPEMITIHLVGQIKTPGVYHLPAGSRVYEALEQAGGVTPEADLARINLARPLYDGEQLKVAGHSDQQPLPVGEEKININLATEEELMTLPGIGAGRARQIIEHRNRHGYFTDITQLMEVSGIGQGIFNNLEEFITVY